MEYVFEWSTQAQEDLESLDHTVAQRMVKKLAWFARQPDPLKFAVRLRPPAIGDARFRIGDYRIIVVVNEKNKKIVIAAVGHRREIYRG